MYFDDLNKKYILLDIEGNAAKRVEERKITQFAAIVFHNGEQQEINLMNRMRAGETAVFTGKKLLSKYYVPEKQSSTFLDW